MKQYLVKNIKNIILGAIILMVPDMLLAQINTAALTVKEKASIDSILYNCDSTNVQIIVLVPPASCTYYVNSIVPSTVPIPPSNTTGIFNLAGATATTFSVEANGCYTDTTIIYPCSIPLEIKFLAFNAVLYRESQGLISWKINEDENVVSYLLEQSYDGRSFELLKQLDVTGENKLKDYAVVDDTLMNGNNYYRLKVKSQDGSIMLSNIVNLNYYKENKIAISIFPNPTQGRLTANINSNMDDILDLKIIDNLGRVVLLDDNIKISKGDNNYNFDISRLADAVYYIEYSLRTQKINGVIKIQKKQ